MNKLLESFDEFKKKTVNEKAVIPGMDVDTDELYNLIMGNDPHRYGKVMGIMISAMLKQAEDVNFKSSRATKIIADLKDLKTQFKIK